MAVVPAAPVPQLTDAQLLELVHGKVAELIGANGEWTVVRRAANDTDTIFHSILAQSVSVDIAAAIAEARRRLEAGEALSEPQHLAAAVSDTAAVPAVEQPVEEPSAHTAAPSPVAEDAPAIDGATVDEAAAAEMAPEREPAAFGWEPAPITQWTDLRKPVTGEFPQVSHRSAA